MCSYPLNFILLPVLKIIITKPSFVIKFLHCEVSLVYVILHSVSFLTFVHLTVTLYLDSSHSRVAPIPSGKVLSSSFFRMDTGVSKQIEGEMVFSSESFHWSIVKERLCLLWNSSSLEQIDGTVVA